jgi:hypothetical protein
MKVSYLNEVYVHGTSFFFFFFEKFDEVKFEVPMAVSMKNTCYILGCDAV